VGKTQDSSSFDPLAIATMGVIEMESKHQSSKRRNPHLTGSMGVQNKRDEEWNLHSSVWLIMERMKVGRRAQSHDPNLLVGHHNCATKSTQGYS
jgi:hypothetical protein